MFNFEVVFLLACSGEYQGFQRNEEEQTYRKYWEFKKNLNENEMVGS